MNDKSNALVPVDNSHQESAMEVATAQSAAMARGQVEAQYLMAERHPRNMDLVRQKLLKECDRAGFAQEAIYSVPRAGTRIEGLSIRFAEGARRVYGNMLTQDSIVYEDDLQQIVRVTCVDFESNSVAMSDVSVPKFVEKRFTRKGDEIVGSRLNSRNETTYKVRATDDDMRMKRNAEASRARRNRILELIPADLREACLVRCRKTLAAGAAEDPDAFRHTIADGFALLRVPADELAKYLGHDLGTSSPDELAELRIVYQTVKDGEATWHECVAAKTGVSADGEEDPHDDLRSTIADKLAASKKRQTEAAKPEAKPEAKEPKAKKGAKKGAKKSDAGDERQPGEEG